LEISQKINLSRLLRSNFILDIRGKNIVTRFYPLPKEPQQAVELFIALVVTKNGPQHIIRNGIRREFRHHPEQRLHKLFSLQQP
jgi:RNase P protein component